MVSVYSKENFPGVSKEQTCEWKDNYLALIRDLV